MQLKSYHHIIWVGNDKAYPTLKDLPLPSGRRKGSGMPVQENKSQYQQIKT